VTSTPLELLTGLNRVRMSREFYLGYILLTTPNIFRNLLVTLQNANSFFYPLLRSVSTERDRERGLVALVQIKQTKVMFRRVRFRALYKRL